VPDPAQLAGLTRGFKETQPGFFRAGHTTPGEYPAQHHAVQAGVYERSFWYQHRERCILDLLERYAPAWLLDVGGSHGMLTEAISRHCPAALLEPDIAGAKAAWNRGLRPVLLGSLATAPFAPRSVAAIGLFDVLEHVPDEHELLRQVHELLENDGTLFISVPAMGWLWSDFDKRVGHQRRYTRRTLNKALRHAGFEPLTTRYLFSILPIPMLLARRWRRSAPGGADSGRHHADRRRLPGRMLSAVLSLERRWLRWGLPVPLGSSCLCVARKVGA